MRTPTRFALTGRRTSTTTARNLRVASKYTLFCRNENVLLLFSWTACTFDKTVNDIAYAYSEGSVKYATSLVKLLLGALPENPDLPVDKG